MSGVRGELTHSYASALARYVEVGGEAALTEAYELGRRAASAGLGVLEVLGIHQRAQAGLAEGASDLRLLMRRSSEFLAEAQSPFEMTLRAYRDAASMLGVGEARSSEGAEIHRAGEQLRAILDATTAPIYLKDAEGRYLFVNRPFQELLGCSSADVVGRRDGEVLPQAVATVLEAHDREALARPDPWQTEETWVLGASVRTFLSLKCPLVDAHGQTYGVCCVATDITDRKQAADALTQAKAALEVANRELESFSYSVAHDLRAPLRSIDGFTQALAEECEGTLPEMGERYMQNIQRAVRSMSDLIDGLMTLAKVSRAELKRKPVDLGAIARDLIEGYRQTQPERQVTLAAEGDLHAEGDPVLLRAVLDNLLGNAWKFTAKTDVGRITVSCDRGGAVPVFSVADNGAGFDMTYAEKLFQPFKRLHSVRDFAGTGIGLATVERIVALHGGRITATGEVGRGATFSFTLTAHPDGQ